MRYPAAALASAAFHRHNASTATKTARSSVIVGFAITVIDEVEAARVFAHLRELGELKIAEERR